MRDSSPVVHRAAKLRGAKFQEGTVLSWTRIANPSARFGTSPRTIALVRLRDGTNVFGELRCRAPVIGMTVRPRLLLSHVTGEKLRVYDVAFEEAESGVATREFPGYILALTGPSGVGKSTISRLLVKLSGGFAEPVPIQTTRPARDGDEQEYCHRSSEEFARMESSGEIVAATRIPSRTEDRRYGYRSADIEAVWRRKKLPIVITEMRLLQSLERHYGRRSILSFGLLPPGKSKRTMLSHLLHRLRTRGRDTEAHIRERLRNAEADLRFFHERLDLFDSLIINDDLDRTVGVLKERIAGLAGG